MHYRVRTIKTHEVEAWQWFPTGHPQHPDLPDEVKAGVREEPATGNARVYHGAEPEAEAAVVQPGDWIISDPNVGLYPLNAEQFVQATRPVEAEDAIAHGPQGPAGHRLAHQRAAQIVGRLVGIVHAEGARYDVDADCHRLVAYLDYLAGQVGHARRLLQPLILLRAALDPYMREPTADVHQSDQLVGEINVPWPESPRAVTVGFGCRVRDLEDARRLFAEPVPLSGGSEPGPEVPPGKPHVPHKDFPTADLTGVQPDPSEIANPDADSAALDPPEVRCPDCDHQQLRIPGQAEYECTACGCTFTEDQPEPEEDA